MIVEKESNLPTYDEAIIGKVDVADTDYADGMFIHHNSAPVQDEESLSIPNENQAQHQNQSSTSFNESSNAVNLQTIKKKRSLGFFIKNFLLFITFVFPYVAIILPIFSNSSEGTLGIYFLNFDFSNSTFKYYEYSDTYHKRDILDDIDIYGYPEPGVSTQDTVYDPYDVYPYGNSNYGDATSTSEYVTYNSNYGDATSTSEYVIYNPTSSHLIKTTSYPYTTLRSSRTISTTSSRISTSIATTALNATEMGIYDVYQYGLTNWYKWNLDSNGNKINITRGLGTIAKGMKLNDELNKDSEKKNHTIFFNQLYLNFNTNYCCGDSYVLGSANNILKCLFPFGIIILFFLLLTDAFSILFIWKFSENGTYRSNKKRKFFLIVCPSLMLVLYFTYAVLIIISAVNYQKGLAYLYSSFKVHYSKALQAITWITVPLFAIRLCIYYTWS